MLKEYKIYVGNFADIAEYLSKVKMKYVKGETEYFEFPQLTMKDQLEEMIKNSTEMGMVSYCKVVEHKDDPIVEVINEFIMIEDIFVVNNKWVEKHPKNNLNA